MIAHASLTALRVAGSVVLLAWLAPTATAQPTSAAAPTISASSVASSGSVVPGSVGNEVHIVIANDTRAPLVGLSARALSVPAAVANLTVEPARIDAIEHDRSAAIIVRFDIVATAAEGPLDPITFEVTAEGGEFPATLAELQLVVTPAPLVTACAIRADAPDDFPVETAFDYCDAGRAPHEYDRVAVFFTPPYDLSEPLADRQPFHWRVVGPNGQAAPIRGSTGGTWAAFAPRLGASRSTPFAAHGSPGRFVAVVDLWQRRDKADPAVATRGPGSYTVQTMAAEYGVEGTFGEGEANTVRARTGTAEDGSPAYAEWEAVASFDVASARLYFQGFVMESVRDAWLPARDDIWEGKLTVDLPRITGSTVDISANAWVRRAHRDGRGRRPQEEVHAAETRVTIEFPERLAPGHEEMGEVRVRVAPVARSRYFFTAGMHLMIPTTERPPDRHLVQGAAMPSPWAAAGALPDNFCGAQPLGQERFATRRTSGDGAWVWSGRPLPVGCDTREPVELEARTVLYSGRPGQTAGLPARPLVAHLGDGSTTWVIPVFVNFTDHAEVRNYSRTLEMKTFGYAIYGAVPGTYAGPAPTGGPPVGSGPDEAVAEADVAGPGPVGAEPDRADPSRRDPARDEPSRRDPSRGDPARRDPAPPDISVADPSRRDPAGGGGAIDPNSLDPTSHDLTALIREWLAVAEPVENASGASFRYDAWGRTIGSAAPGQGRTVGSAPPPDGGGVPEAFAWRFRTELDSIDHCTLEEYVIARIANASTSHCVGRYSRTLAVPDVTGMPFAEAVGALRRAGFEVAPALLGPAPRRDLGGRVAAQRPAPMARLGRGGQVEIDVHGDHVEMRAGVPDVRGMTLPEAQAALTRAGFGMAPSLLGAATTAAEAGRVSAQTPAPGAEAAPGSPVQVDLWGDYVPPAPAVRDTMVATSAGVLEGRPNLQCPAALLGGTLTGGSGYQALREYGYFHCEWGDARTPHLHAHHGGVVDEPRLVRRTLLRGRRCRLRPAAAWGGRLSTLGAIPQPVATGPGEDSLARRARTRLDLPARAHLHDHRRALRAAVWAGRVHVGASRRWGLRRS
jgi:hypothetical protein